MLKLNRKTEYALLAVEHMSRKEAAQGVSSTREISEAYQIPYPLLAKIMQQLANNGLVKAIKGTKGGYMLAKPSVHISVADVVEIFEGEVAMAECLKHEKITCPQWDGCSIKDPLYELNQKIYSLLSHTTVHDLLGPSEDKGTLPVFGEAP